MEKEETEDMCISDLPDAILHQILSLVPTKTVIVTSSVSKRWREISAGYLAYPNNLEFGEDFAKQRTPDQFTENLNRILSINRSDKIDRFKLMFSPRNEQHKSNAVNWIKFATSRGVKEIELDFCRHIHIHFLSRAHIVGGNEAFELPNFLFDCRSLVTVNLRRCIMSLPENYTGFGSISTLYLKDVHVTDEMLENLLCNCKLLEVLVLKECESLSRIRILSAVKLRQLTVYECYKASSIEISCPNIRSLLISAGHLNSCKLENAPVLEEVFLGTRGDEFGGVFYIFMKVLSDLSHVRTLTLYLGHLVPSLFRDFQAKFNNLEELQLVNSPLFGLFNTDVYCFFKHCSCPSLKNITIELSTVSDEENFIWEFRVSNIERTKCVFNNLRSVTLLNYRGTSSDLELVTFFLESAPILESMILVKPPKSNLSCMTSVKGDESFKGMQKSLCDKFLYNAQTSANVDVQVSDDNEHNNLLSIFKGHHVSDVYHK